MRNTYKYVRNELEDTYGFLKLQDKNKFDHVSKTGDLKDGRSILHRHGPVY